MLDRFASALLLFSSLVGIAGSVWAQTRTAATTSKPHSVDRAIQPALAPLQDFVGRWKGVGQVRRGSSQGAWSEEAEWRWDFSRGAALVFAAPKSKHLVNGRIAAASPNDADGGAAASSLRLEVVTAAGDVLNYSGTLNAADASLVFTNDEVPAGAASRVTLRFAAEKKRMVAVLERRTPGGATFLRLAEIGYTRVGGGFAENADAGPRCIVTGGSAEIAVQHAGKTYYVCCTGCKDVFDADPAQFVAAHEAKRKR